MSSKTLNSVLDDLQAYLATRGDEDKPLDRIVCKDGFSLSVQASRYSYCSPRGSYGPWAAAEVGYPSDKEEALMSYVEDAERPTETVYGYVPMTVIAQVIFTHGGFAERAP